FFFSSRRRHTRSKRDWSSDVCSSDLPMRPSTTSRRSCCARCSDTGPSLEPGVAVGCARLHGLGVEELVDGDEGVALLRELLQYLRDRLDGAPVDVVEEQNTALGGLLYGHV